MHFATAFSIIAALTASTYAQNNTIGSFPSCTNENGVAECNGYTCRGAIYVGCDYNLKNAFCCEGAHVQQNICNSPQPTTCSQGTYVPLTKAGGTKTAGSGSSPSAASMSSGSAGSAAAASSSSMTGVAAMPTIFPQHAGVGALAVAVKVLFL